MNERMTWQRQSECDQNAVRWGYIKWTVFLNGNGNGNKNIEIKTKACTDWTGQQLDKWINNQMAIEVNHQWAACCTCALEGEDTHAVNAIPLTASWNGEKIKWKTWFYFYVLKWFMDSTFKRPGQLLRSVLCVLPLFFVFHPKQKIWNRRRCAHW